MKNLPRKGDRVYLISHPNHYGTVHAAGKNECGVVWDGLNILTSEDVSDLRVYQDIGLGRKVY